MKKMVIKILLITLFIYFNAYGQTGWVMQNSGITSRLNSLSFVNSETGWVMSISDPTVLLKTTNGGNNWNLNFPNYGRMYDIYFQDLYTGWVTGGYGVVLKTTNGGTNWNPLGIHLIMEYFLSMDFIDSVTGWVVGTSGHILKTSDGYNFVRQLYSWNYAFYSVDFIDQNVGWAVGENASMFKTIDGGKQWNRVLPLPYWTTFRCVKFFDKSTGFVCGNGGLLMISTDGGSVWQQQNSLTSKALYSINFVNSFTGYCVGDTGIIIKTTNRGINWYIQQSGADALYDIEFTSSDTGYACGFGGEILRTIDGGGILNDVKDLNHIPTSINLSQNYSNPFNPNTKIKFDIASNNNSQSSDIKLIVYNVKGQEIETLVNEKLNAGTYEADFNADGLTSGIYFYSLMVDGIISETKKMILIR